MYTRVNVSCSLPPGFTFLLGADDYGDIANNMHIRFGAAQTGEFEILKECKNFGLIAAGSVLIDADVFVSENLTQGFNIVLQLGRAKGIVVFEHFGLVRRRCGPTWPKLNKAQVAKTGQRRKNAEHRHMEFTSFQILRSEYD
jgi:hypothetical protein